MGTLYLLLQPDTYKIRYVGVTIRDPRSRFLEHVAPCRSIDRTYKSNWIDSLRKKGLRPILFILDYMESVSDLLKAEQGTIEELTGLGCRLVNGTSGGDGVRNHVWTEEQRRHNSETQVKRFQDPKERAAASIRGKSYFETHPSAILQMSLAAKRVSAARSKEETSQLYGKVSQSLRKYYEENPEAAQRLSESHKKSWKDADARRQQARQRMQDRYADPKARELQRNLMIERFKNPEEKEKISDGLKKTLATPEAKVNKANASKNTWANKTPEQRAAWGRAISAGRKKKTPKHHLY